MQRNPTTILPLVLITMLVVIAAAAAMPRVDTPNWAGPVETPTRCIAAHVVAGC